ncbi:MAG: hypothetical protein SAMD01599839_14890 [Rectinema sp.]
MSIKSFIFSPIKKKIKHIVNSVLEKRENKKYKKITKKHFLNPLYYGNLAKFALRKSAISQRMIKIVLLMNMYSIIWNRLKSLDLKSS